MEDEQQHSQGLDEEESHGVWFLNHKEYCVDAYETPEDINEVFAANLPNKQHHHPEVEAEKEKELDKLKEFNAANKVEFTGKEHFFPVDGLLQKKSDGSVLLGWWSGILKR